MVALVGFLALLSSCQRHVSAEREMTWVCKPDPGHDGKQVVELRFVENPKYFHVEEGSHLCDALQSLARRTVTVQFDLLGDLSGYRRSSSVGINGVSTPFSDLGVGSGSLGTDDPGVDPLKTAYDRLARR